MKPAREENPSSTPPKLSLFSLSRQPPEPPGLLTPPLHASVSVPFQWEEAPGKPRPFGIDIEPPKPKSARSLDLPPRLFTDAKVAHFASPTTVVDESTAGQDPSSPLSFRFPDSWAETEGGKGRGGTNTKFFGSRRWGSFRKKKETQIRNSSLDSSASTGGGGANGYVSGGDTDTKVKITRFRSRRSLLGNYSSTSHLVGSIYESLKQVIPWRRRQDQM